MKRVSRIPHQLATHAEWEARKEEMRKLSLPKDDYVDGGLIEGCLSSFKIYAEIGLIVWCLWQIGSQMSF
jgi:hypothetical protein